MMDQADVVRAVTFVALCKEWFGEGNTGDGGALKACTLAGSNEDDRREEFKHLWDLSGHLSDMMRLVE